MRLDEKSIWPTCTGFTFTCYFVKFRHTNDLEDIRLLYDSSRTIQQFNAVWDTCLRQMIIFHSKNKFIAEVGHWLATYKSSDVIYNKRPVNHKPFPKYAKFGLVYMVVNTCKAELMKTHFSEGREDVAQSFCYWNSHVLNVINDHLVGWHTAKCLQFNWIKTKKKEPT